MRNLRFATLTSASFLLAACSSQLEDQSLSMLGYGDTAPPITLHEDAAPADRQDADSVDPPPEADASTPSDAGARLDSGASDAGPTNPPTFISKRGALLFSDDFSDATLAPTWAKIGGTWNVVNGELVGSSPAGELDPNIGRTVDTDRAVIQFRFKLMGAGEAQVRLNHKEDVAPQHLLQARIPGPGIDLFEMSGWATETTKKLVNNADAGILSGRYYTAVLEVFDRRVSLSIDGVQRVSAMIADQSATPKNHLVFSAFGSSVAYDDIKVWNATAP